jgi:hypothetical protein
MDLAEDLNPPRRLNGKINQKIQMNGVLMMKKPKKKKMLKKSKKTKIL